MNLVTNLVGTDVIIGEETYGYGYGPRKSLVGKRGCIVSVYLDKDRDPKYTIRVLENEELVDLYSQNFSILPT